MKLSSAQKRSLSTTAERYNKTVAEAASYLGARALWDRAITDSYLLGVVTDPAPGDEPYAGRLSIPYITPSGVVNLKFRCIEAHDCKEIEHHVKYLGLPGAPDRVYNVQALHEAGDKIYVAEGELDALSSTVAGRPCIGISGGNKWEPHYTKLLEDYDDVVVFADGDSAGRNFAKRFRSELTNSRIVYFPDGEDVNSFLASGSVDDFRDFVDG